MKKTAFTGGILAALALALVVAPPAQAQTQAQTGQLGWAAWIGCWQPADGSVAAGALCVRPSQTEEGAVEILRVEDDQVLEREVVWADGTRHETVREECTGWEEGSFSRDGRRVFVRSSHTCDDGSVNEGGGLMAMATADEWLDIRYLEVGGETTAWVQRYRPAELEVWEAVGMGDLASSRVTRIYAARRVAAEAPDVDDVIEASAHLPAEAVEAWIAEKGDPFALDADKLVALDDAGVADRVIDVVVAVSNPDAFALANGPERLERPSDGVRRGYRGGFGLYDSFYWRRPYRGLYYGSAWSPFGWGWGYSYNPIHGGYYGGGYRPTVIVVEPRGGGGTRDRVIAGRGYRSYGSGSGSSSGSSGAVRPRRPSSSAGSGSSSAAPSTSRPRPSTSRPTPRKAKPRPPGKKKSGGGI